MVSIFETIRRIRRSRRERKRLGKSTNLSPFEASITLVFLLAGEDRSVEHTFRLSDTIESVQKRLFKDLPSAELSADLTLAWNGNTLDPVDRLSTTFKRGGFVSNPISIQNIPKLEPRLNRILEMKESHEVVDAIMALLTENTERYVLVSIYSAAVEGAGSVAEQAEIMGDVINSMGLYRPLTPMGSTVLAEAEVLPPATTSTSVDIPTAIFIPNSINEFQWNIATTPFGGNTDLQLQSATVVDENDWTMASTVASCTNPSTEEASPPDFYNTSTQRPQYATVIDANGATPAAASIEATSFRTPMEEILSESAALGINAGLASFEDEIECPICQEKICESRTIQMNCSHGHTACMECVCDWVKASIDQGPQIKCFGGEGCNYELMQQEIALVLGHGDVIKGQKESEFEIIDINQRDAAIAQDPQSFAYCPSPNCNWIVARHSKGASEAATCPDCNLVFCTNCNDIYHYRNTCIQMREKKYEWEQWILSGRKQYWKDNERERVKANRVAKKEKKRIESIRAIEAKDEAYKAANCRHCIHCNRVVERTGGCSAMRCGYDTDTGYNKQNGCGQSFDWNKAKLYQPVEVGKHIKQQSYCQPTLSSSSNSNSDSNNNSSKFLHVGVMCDQCGSSSTGGHHEGIRGLRFDCINCKSYTLCENCEMDHSGNNHYSGRHIFEIKRGVD